MNSPPSFSFDLMLVLRILQTLLALLIMILSSTVISFFNTHIGIGSPPHCLVFTTFTAVLTLLISLPYNTFAAKYFAAYTNRYSSMAVELITMIFWFASWISVAVYVGGLRVCRGSVCGTAKAVIVFSAIEWLLFCASGWMPVYYTFFDKEHASLGLGNSRLGLSGAERITAARMRREAANNERVRAEREGEKTGIVAGVTRGLKNAMGTGKVRMGNVLEEWRVKSGRSRESVNGNRTEMTESRYGGNVV